MELNMDNVDQRLGTIEKKLDGISEALSKIAVQSEQITTLQSGSALLWDKCDKMNDKIAAAQTFQAGCPRKAVDRQTVWMWGLTVSLLLLTIGALVT